jgi:hypothetical protein
MLVRPQASQFSYSWSQDMPSGEVVGGWLMLGRAGTV